MYYFVLRWSALKNEELKLTRGVSFEEIIEADVLAGRNHPSRENQRLLLFDFMDYVWVVPLVIRGDEIFLKTAYRSRKFTKMWRTGRLP
jgi:hypothetical protein